jgi:type II secretory ATPase GspE/PulE/Tfp pilus assembly ATPase PilB-like protein
MGIAMYKISAALIGVVAQRLVRNACPKCKTNYYPTAEVLDRLSYQGDRRRQFVRGEGCPNCFDTGFRGRTGIYEVLSVTSELRDLMTPDLNSQDVRRWYQSKGGQLLIDQGVALAEKGITSPEEILRVAGVD